MTNDTLQWASIDSPWTLAELALKAGCTRLFLSGAPGIGKTHLASFGLGNRQVYQISYSEDLSVQESIGHFMPSGAATWSWHDGPVTAAMRQGAVLVLNEINRASDAVKDALLGVMDDSQVAALTLPSGETVRPAGGFTVIGTSNEPISALDPALQDRFEVAVALDGPAAGVVARLNASIPGLGDAIRDSYKDSGRELSPRRGLTFARLIERGIVTKQAALMAFGDRGPDVLEVLLSRGVEL